MRKRPILSSALFPLLSPERIPPAPRDRVNSPQIPGIAAQNTPQSQNTSPHSAKPLYRLQRIAGAGGIKPAAGNLHGRNPLPIKSDHPKQNLFHFIKCANCLRITAATSSILTLVVLVRATNMMSHPNGS